MRRFRKVVCVLAAIMLFACSVNAYADTVYSDVDQGSYTGYDYTCRASRTTSSVSTRVEYEVNARLEIYGVIACGKAGEQDTTADISGYLTNTLFTKSAASATFLVNGSYGWTFNDFECNYYINWHLVSTLAV